MSDKTPQPSPPPPSSSVPVPVPVPVDQPPEKEKEKEKEDVVVKYKRLLTMARSSLEANQATLLEKDTQIKKLKKLLEEENIKSKQLFQQQQQLQQASRTADDDGDNVPRQILRYLQVDDTIHILVEYTGMSKDTWLQFKSNTELNDWIQSVPGVPLVLPQKCLTVEESSRIETDCKKSVERIVEEFRRYKVRSEIARKQKDSEQKHASSSSPAPTPSVEQAMSQGTLGYFSSMTPPPTTGEDSSDGVSSSFMTSEVKALINKESNRWKLAYESVMKENEQLRHRGGESLLATQWRERYEICVVEKEELLEKYKLLLASTGGSLSEDAYGQANSSSPGKGKNFQQMYIELKEEFKEFHSRVLALEKERERKRELRRNGGISEEKDLRSKGGRSSGNSSRIQPYGGGGETAKMEYIKNLILQYLCCKDIIVRNHMEIAIMQMFRFSDEEKSAIEDRKKGEENYEEALLSSITNFVSSTFFNSS